MNKLLLNAINNRYKGNLFENIIEKEFIKLPVEVV